MKKSILSIIASILCLSSYSAFAIDANIQQGFYVKGYLGGSFSVNENLQVHGNQGYPDPYNDFSSRIGKTFLWGGGIGYRINSLLRIDLTYDNRSGFKYDKTFTNSDRHRTFTIDNDTYMANLYFDASGIPKFPSTIFCPYVGFGLGLSYNKTKDYTSAAISTSVTNYVSSYTRSSMAWQVMLGSSIDLAQHIQLDLGYRYASLGKIAVGTHSITEPNLTLSTLSTSHAGANELYLGLRYIY
jgi:opacity protein-like surface antigen